MGLSSISWMSCRSLININKTTYIHVVDFVSTGYGTTNMLQTDRQTDHGPPQVEKGRGSRPIPKLTCSLICRGMAMYVHYEMIRYRLIGV